MSDFPDRVRAFVALRLSTEVEEAIAGFIAALGCADRRAAPRSQPPAPIRWTRRASLHLTLRFLGNEVTGPTLAAVDAGLAAVAVATAPLVVRVRGTGAFPDLLRPRVIWIGLESAGLVELARRIDRVAVEAGLAPEARPYSPHLTIGRVRTFDHWSATRRVLEAAAQRDFGTLNCASMVLYRSILGRSDPYSELARYNFAVH